MHEEAPHWVITLPRRRMLRVREGETLLEACRREDLPLASSCAGRAACGACAVQIVEGAEGAVPAGAEELRWSAGRDLPGATRLACRLVLRGSASVTASYW